MSTLCACMAAAALALLLLPMPAAAREPPRPPNTPVDWGDCIGQPDVNA